MEQNIERLNKDFLDEYGKFEKYIQEKYKTEKITDDLIKEHLTKPSIYFWISYRNLRNIKSHGSTKFIADITELGLEKFKEEVSKIINPPTAYDICTINPYKITDKHNLSEVLKIMKENNYSNVPIIDENEYAKGMFNANTLFLYANSKDEVIIDCPKTIIEYFKPLYEMNEKSEIIYDFIGKKTNIFAVKEKFEEAKKKNKKLEALFVTETGKQNQKIIGIITPWDIIQHFPENNL